MNPGTTITKEAFSASSAERVEVTISGEPGEYFQAWSLGEDWNGFECPYFEQEEALKVAKVFGGSYQEKRDAFRFEPEGCEEVFRPETIKTPEGMKKVYPIGHSAWTWQRKAV